ncbi:unnamed protein product [Pylaiella littoralis]
MLVLGDCRVILEVSNSWCAETVASPTVGDGSSRSSSSNDSERWRQGRRVVERQMGECTNAPSSTTARVPRASRKRKGGPRGDAPVRSRQKVCAVCVQYGG